MVYCSKCGKKNEDDAGYCNQCGSPLSPKKRDLEKEWEDQCEKDCAGGKNDSPLWRIFWGLFVVFLGLWILFEIVLKNLVSNYDIPSLAWVENFTFEFWWIIGLLFGVIIVVSGLKILLRK